MDYFEFDVEIEIQGDNVQNLLHLSQDLAKYEVIGFDKQKIIIDDYRKDKLLSLQKLIETDRLEEFANYFNTPARITLQYNDENDILVELNETDNPLPKNMLWIAIGIQDSIPIYDYEIEWISPLPNNEFAFFAIFQIPQKELENQLLSVSLASS